MTTTQEPRINSAEFARLEAEVKRRQAAAGAARPAGADPVRVGEGGANSTAGDAHLRKLRRIAAQHGTSIPEDLGPDDDQDSIRESQKQLQAETRAVTWRNSLAAAYLTRMAHHTLAGLDETQFPERLKFYVDNLRSKELLNIALFGGVGSGKTSAAVAMGSYAASRGLMVRIVRHADYIAWLRPDGAEMPNWKVHDRFTKYADLLILDDVGAGLTPDHPATRHVRDETLRLIDKRIGSEKGTVITTNESPDSLERILGERIISRLQDRGMGLMIQHDDRRRADGCWPS